MSNENLNNEAVKASSRKELLERAVAVAEAARQLLLLHGYDGECVGEDIAPLMDTIIKYDAVRKPEAI